MCCPPRNVAQFWSGAHLQRGQPVVAAKESGLLQSWEETILFVYFWETKDVFLYFLETNTKHILHYLSTVKKLLGVFCKHLTEGTLKALVTDEEDEDGNDHNYCNNCNCNNRLAMMPRTTVIIIIASLQYIWPGRQKLSRAFWRWWSLPTCFVVWSLYRSWKFDEQSAALSLMRFLSW